MQNAKGKAKFKTSQCKSRAMCEPLAGGERPGWQVVQSCTWESTDPSVPGSQHTVPAVGTHSTSTLCSAVALVLPHGKFQLYVLLKKSNPPLFVSQNSFLCCEVGIPCCPPGLRDVRGKNHFHPISLVLWNRVQTVVTAGKLLAGIGQDEMEQKLTLIFNTDCSCNKILTLHSSHHKAKPEPWLSAGGNITSSTKKPNRAKSRSPAGDY